MGDGDPPPSVLTRVTPCTRVYDRGILTPRAATPGLWSYAFCVRKESWAQSPLPVSCRTHVDCYCLRHLYSVVLFSP